MPRDTNGNFDQVVEIGVDYFRRQAATRLSSEPKALESGPAGGFHYSGTVVPTVRNVWFGDAAEVFDEDTGSWNAVAQVAPFNAIVFAVEMTGHVDIDKVPVPGSGGLTIAPAPGAERLEVHAAALFLAPLSVQRHAARTARDQNFPAERTLCAVALMPTGPFLTNIKVDVAAIRRSPFTKWASQLVLDAKLGDPEVVVVKAVRDALHNAVETQLLATMQTVCDWRIDGEARVGVVVPTPEMGVRDMEVVTTFQSIRVFMRTTGPGGQTALATRSQLAGASVAIPADDIVITVNGRAFVERLRTSITGAFKGLKPGDFLPGEPCTVNKEVGVVLSGSPFTLQYLQAGVDESSRVVIWFFLQTIEWWGTADIEIELPLTIGVERDVRSGRQVLVLTPQQQEATYAVAAYTVPVIHWIIEAIVHKMVGDSLRSPLDLDPELVDVPQTEVVAVNSVSLNQPGAPTGDRTWPSTTPLIGGGVGLGVASHLIGLHPGRYRDHDLVIHLSAARYPTPLAVDCVKPDGSDPVRRIDGLGGSFTAPAGASPRPWAMPIDDAIDWLLVPGNAMTSDGVAVVVGRQPADYPPANPTAGTLPYLRTAGDAGDANNLAARPTC